VVAPDFQTLLTISLPSGVPLYSARGLTMTLKVIDAATQLERTVNGELLDLAEEQFRLYAAEITCADQEAPAIDGVWPGMTVVIHCPFELAYVTSGGSPTRPVVSGSSRNTADGFTYYRPVMTFKVRTVEYSSFDEWKHEYQWKLSLEEVGPGA
jgi:hypothetical protein